jgi:hypothetical protein
MVPALARSAAGTANGLPPPATPVFAARGPSHAAALFALVERNGPHNTRIEISN